MWRCGLVAGLSGPWSLGSSCSQRRTVGSVVRVQAGPAGGYRWRPAWRWVRRAGRVAGWFRGGGWGRGGRHVPSEARGRADEPVPWIFDGFRSASRPTAPSASIAEAGQVREPSRRPRTPANRLSIADGARHGWTCIGCSWAGLFLRICRASDLCTCGGLSRVAAAEVTKETDSTRRSRGVDPVGPFVSNQRQ